VNDGFVTDVVFHPGNKENLASVPLVELFKVEISSVCRYYRTRFRFRVFEIALSCIFASVIVTNDGM